MEAAAVGMVAVGVGVVAGTVVVGMEAVAGMDVEAGDVAAGIGGEAGGPDTAGAVIPTTLTIPIILGVINPGGPFFIVLVLGRFRLIQRAPKERCVTRLETGYFLITQVTKERREVASSKCGHN
jgi:hypothetical protein